jgi:hypothetical protein
MALQRENMVQRSSGTATLELQAQANESILVKRILVFDPTSNADDITITVERRRIFQFSAPDGWYLISQDPATGAYSMIDQLFKQGMMPTIPVAAGQKLQLSGGVANQEIEIVYDLYDDGDITADQRNGSAAADWDFFNTISNASASTATGSLDLDQSDLDSLWPQFPGGARVPSGMTFRLKALYGIPVSIGDGAEAIAYTERIKLIQDQTSLVDKDLGGFLYEGDDGYATATVKYEDHKSRLWGGKTFQPPQWIHYETPLVFPEGSELTVQAVIAGSTGVFSAAVVKLGFWFDVHRV